MGERRGSPATPPDGRGIRLGLVTAQFNAEVTERMRDEARATAKRLGATIAHDVEVPGTFDIGLVAKKLLARRDVDAIVAIGAVVQGETRHDELVAGQAARILADLALQHGKPVGLAITGPGQTSTQALARIDRAAWAVESIVKQFRTLESLRRSDARTR